MGQNIWEEIACLHRVVADKQSEGHEMVQIVMLWKETTSSLGPTSEYHLGSVPNDI